MAVLTDLFASANFPWASSIGAIILVIFICFQNSKGPKVAGPWLARHTRLWYLWQMYQENFHQTNIKIHRENGKIVQIAPGYYSFDDSTALKLIYGHGSQLVKGTWYNSWNFNPNPEATNLFSERFPARHSIMRRKVASLYSMTSLLSYEPYVDNCIDLLNNHFTKFAQSSTNLNLAHWLQCYAFDVIGEITYGERFGFLDKGEDISDLMKTLDSTFSYASAIGLFPFLRPIFDPIAGFLTQKLYYVQKFAEERVLSTKQMKMDISEDGPVYMAKKLISTQMKDEKKGITHQDIVTTTAGNVGAGSDTTGLSLSATLFYLYQHPHCLQELREEIAQAGLQTTERFTFQEVQRLPYLQAAIKEALRVFPGTGFPMWRIVPPGGLTLCGQVFPEGSNVGVNSWVAHFDTTVYGADADEYKPERWLEADTEQAKAMEQNFMPFGYGARTCIGKNISLLEMNKLIPLLVRDFDIQFLKKDGSPETSRSLDGHDKWFVKPGELSVKLAKRI